LRKPVERAMDEQEIIRKILNGNPDAYEKIVNRYCDRINNLCYRYLFDMEDARDATQDVFIRAYHGLKNWEPRAQFHTWLYRIAINHCLNLLRRRKIVKFQALDNSISKPLIDYNAGDDRIIKKQNEMRIKNYINQLPESQRTVIILYFYQQLSYREIADILKISLSSVESRLFRAKKKLAKIIGRQNR
jgi:RNA polymerase sigma-70 factor (ECF subfamily)